MARNHYVIATSTSADLVQVARSLKELESGRFAGLCPEVDLWLRQHMDRDQARMRNEGKMFANYTRLPDFINDIVVALAALWLLLQRRKEK